MTEAEAMAYVPTPRQLRTIDPALRREMLATMLDACKGRYDWEEFTAEGKTMRVGQVRRHIHALRESLQ